MTIITSKKELEKHLDKAREDIAYWRVYSFEKVIEEITLKLEMNNKSELCIK